MALSKIDVANMLTGEVPNANVATVGVAKGGTGLTSGTSGQFLKFTGSTTLASAADNAGKILQVVYDNKSSTTSTSNRATQGNFADVMSVNITPTSSSSTIAISAMVNTGASNSSDGNCILRCLRDSTQIAGGTASGSRISTTSARGTENQDANSGLTIGVEWMDSPNTTSQVTYKVQFACRGNATSETAYIGQTGNDGNNNEQQRTPCHLRLMEIAG